MTVSSCAFRDCGDPACQLCALARIPMRKVQGKAADGLRDDAKALPQAPKPESPNKPKRKHRVGPHR